MMTKSKWSAALLLVATFVLGALTGGAALATADRGESEWRRPSGGMVERLAVQLDLDASQQDSVRAILERHHDEFIGIRDQIGTEIRAVLTEEQLQRFESMQSEMRMHKSGHRRHESTTSTRKTEGQ